MSISRANVRPLHVMNEMRAAPVAPVRAALPYLTYLPINTSKHCLNTAIYFAFRWSSSPRPWVAIRPCTAPAPAAPSRGRASRPPPRPPIRASSPGRGRPAPRARRAAPPRAYLLINIHCPRHFRLPPGVTEETPCSRAGAFRPRIRPGNAVPRPHAVPSAPGPGRPACARFPAALHARCASPLSPHC